MFLKHTETNTNQAMFQKIPFYISRSPFTQYAALAPFLSLFFLLREICETIREIASASGLSVRDNATWIGRREGSSAVLPNQTKPGSVVAFPSNSKHSIDFLRRENMGLGTQDMKGFTILDSTRETQSFILIFWSIVLNFYEDQRQYVQLVKQMVNYFCPKIQFTSINSVR